MELKFKTGDSIAIPEGCKAVVKDNVVIFEAIKQEFKRGDFLASKNSNKKVIFKEYQGEESFVSFFSNTELNNYGWYPPFFRLATPEEKAELIEFMRENGKDWDEAKCEVVDYRWRAEKGENYSIVASGGIDILKEVGDSADDDLYSYGNYFKTKELAEIALQKRNELFLTLKHS